MRRMRGRAAIAALAVFLSSCSGTPQGPYEGLPEAATELSDLAVRLTTGELETALIDSPTTAAEEFAALMAGMDSYTPRVDPGEIAYSQDSPTAQGTLRYTWSFPSGEWTYDATVDFHHVDSSWVASWSPTVLHPSLSSTTQLNHWHVAPQRAGMLALDGSAIVEEYEIVRVGIDKTKITSDQFESSARQLAAIVGIDADSYATRVLAAGPKAFVIAITLRQYAVPQEVASVPGSYGQRGTSMLAPTSTFGQPLIGALREATAEDIEKSEGLIEAGEQVGASGVQASFDSVLRGSPGDIVYITTRGDAVAPSKAPESDVLYSADATDGTAVHLGFDAALQQKAEDVLAAYDGGTAAVVIVRPSTGAVLAAANTPGWGAIPDATGGAYAPGSTFKVVVTLALLRKGYTQDSVVSCPSTLNIGGQAFKNVAGYPSNRLGNITLGQALANSCNTAFIGLSSSLAPQDLSDAAGSLGFGTEYSTGAGFNFGTLPEADSDAMKAMITIGQGGVLANPLSMAAVAASVAAGHTVIPWIVQERQPQSTATALTETEAASLRAMMSMTVSEGGATSMQGWVTGAKTGTAQWGPSDAVKTHAWMIAFTDDLAIAVWVKEGAGGARVAGPLITQLLG